jgi:predicted site-specific integrase-resolvase
MSIGEAATLLGVCVGTLRNWEAKNLLKPTCRTLGGHRRYDVNDLPTDGMAKDPAAGKTIAYARVSSHDQKQDPERQSNRLQHECRERGFEDVEVIADLGSGLNFNKRGLRRLLGLICRRQIRRLVIMHKDRLLRFGAELVFDLCRHSGIEVVIVEQADTDFTATLASDVIELMTVFSARMYGARSHKNRKPVAA